MAGRLHYQVGADFQVEPAKASVFRRGRRVSVRYQTFKVLLYLLERRGQLVTKEELFSSISPAKAVSDDSIAQSIAELRRLFGDTARSARFIRTRPRSGYVLVAPVEVGWQPEARLTPAVDSDAVPPAGEQHRWWGTAPAVLGLEKW